MTIVENYSGTELATDNTLIHEHDNAIVYWYSAFTDFGKINIGLLKDQTDKSARLNYKDTVLDRIITLSREEENIRQIEDWLNEGLDLRPVNRLDGAYYTLKLSKSNNTAKSVKNTIIIKIDRDTILKLPVPNWQAEQNIYIDSSRIPVNLILSNSTIDKQYAEFIKEENVLLIPDAFSEDWIGQVSAFELNDSNIAAKIDGNLQSIYINNITNDFVTNIDSKTQNCNSLQLRVDCEIEIPFHLLLGWEDTSHYIFKKRLNNYTINISSNNKTIAIGRLVPVSNGYGVYIDDRE
ncbi:MAG: hypothetical protein K1566_02975 [Candidatus Thiodiazotropha sp. (ex. Lucinisca nassula)]|nr:hypothetical protein [Candidatus Thiodiazotropha sp. (ex. Lucinisca nassula)]